MLTEHIPLPNCAPRHIYLEQRQPKKDSPGWVIIAYVWPAFAPPNTTVALQRVEIASYDDHGEAMGVVNELTARLRVLEVLTNAD